MNIIKRDGSVEEFSVDKLNRVVSWACDGLNANPSDILMDAKLKMTDEIKTTKLHELLIQSAANLISLRTPDYQHVASRLLNFYLRKQIFGVFEDSEMPSVYEVCKRNVELGLYDSTFITKWSHGDFREIDKIIDHSNDSKLTYASYKKMRDSYFVRNRDTGYIYETPQYMFIVLAMSVSSTIAEVRSYYSDFVNKRLSLPTPVLAGLRTPTKQFASCTLIDMADDIDSIYGSTHALGRYVVRKAGLGVNTGRWRALGDPIRNGEAIHTGVTPFLRMIQGATKSVSQGAIRDAGNTVYTTIWHPEIMDILVLKNNKGTDDNRVKNLDYGIQVSGLFWKRMTMNKPISLFSNYYAPKLYDAWGTPEFDMLYEQYEQDESIPRKVVNGQELLLLLSAERLGTGRIYIMNIDNVNEQNRFNDKINQSNLCAEITLPTTPIYNVNDESGEIALCNIAGLNVGMLRGEDTFHKMEEPLRNLVRLTDQIISIQDYPVQAASKQLYRRSMGIGITNFAYWMAKNGLKPDSDEALILVDKLFEHFQFYLLKASMELSKELGPAEFFDRTKYSQGYLPNDLANPRAKALTGDRELICDWEWLRNEIKTWGLRNSVLSAQMPVESSSIVTNSTNGIEFPRGLFTVKTNKTSAPTPMIVPSAKSLASKYTLSWEIESNSTINKLTAVMQKWIDQAISVNHYYNPLRYADQKIPSSVIIKDMVEFYRLGGKCLYYANTLDAIQDDPSVGCDDGGCAL